MKKLLSPHSEAFHMIMSDTDFFQLHIYFFAFMFYIWISKKNEKLKLFVCDTNIIFSDAQKEMLCKIRRIYDF